MKLGPAPRSPGGPRVHRLKTWPDAFAAVVEGRKTFEYRCDDRRFLVGDVLVLEEYDPVGDRHVGPVSMQLVTYVARGPDFGIPAGFAVLSLTPDFGRILTWLDYHLDPEVRGEVATLVRRLVDVVAPPPAADADPDSGPPAGEASHHD